MGRLVREEQSVRGLAEQLLHWPREHPEPHQPLEDRTGRGFMYRSDRDPRGDLLHRSATRGLDNSIDVALRV